MSRKRKISSTQSDRTRSASKRRKTSSREKSGRYPKYLKFSSLVNEVKKTQKMKKELWYEYLEKFDETWKDPARYNAKFLMRFLNTTGCRDLRGKFSGPSNLMLPRHAPPIAPPPGLDHRKFSYLVKICQRLNSELWDTYLEKNNKVDKDPKFHRDEFLVKFLEHASKEDQNISQRLNLFDIAEPLLTSLNLSYENLVILTQCHVDFQRYTDLKCESFPKSGHGLKLVGLDCEMCVTTESDKALLKMTIVDAEKKEVLTDIWVKPPHPILDFKSHITGMTRAAFREIKGLLSFEEARNKLLEYVDARTILIGHGLYEDLKCLQFGHIRIIDTSLLLRNPEQPLKRVDISKLVFDIFGIMVSTSTHCSVDEVMFSLDLIQFVKENGIPPHCQWF
jgi:hypothetical protein